MLVLIFVENNVNGCSTTMKNRELKRQQSNSLSSEFKCEGNWAKILYIFGKTSTVFSCMFQNNLPDSHT